MLNRRARHSRGSDHRKLPASPSTKVWAGTLFVLAADRTGRPGPTGAPSACLGAGWTRLVDVRPRGATAPPTPPCQDQAGSALGYGWPSTGWTWVGNAYPSSQ